MKSMRLVCIVCHSDIDTNRFEVRGTSLPVCGKCAAARPGMVRETEKAKK